MELDELGELGETGLQWALRQPGMPARILGHRGSVGPARENTVEAFSAALAAGADGVELDVRATASGTPVVLHDAEVPGQGLLCDLADEALPGWLPTLNEALAACAGAVVDVELKGPPPGSPMEPVEQLAGQVAELLTQQMAAEVRPSALVVSSFWPNLLEVVHRARPELTLGLLVTPGLDALAAVEPAGALGASVILPFREAVSADMVTHAHQRGLAVWVWTVNDRADLLAMDEAGVDALVTDRVAHAMAVLRPG